MTPREKALRAIWHGWASHWPLQVLHDALSRDNLPEELAILRDFWRWLEGEIAGGRKTFCEVCETIHPPVRPGQPLLLPTLPAEAERVMRAHVLDEARRAGPAGVPFGMLVGRLSGERPS